MVQMSLILGDCLEEMKKIPDKSIDCVITDPPYFIGFSSFGKTSNRQDWGNHTLLVHLFDSIFTEFKRMLKKNGKLFVFCDWRTYPSFYLASTKYFNIPNLIVWDYNWIKAGTHFRFSHEFILYGIMEETEGPEDRTISDVWHIKPINFTIERNHQAEKPLEIIDKMLNVSTKENQTILDPFMGSGTTGVACKRLNRNFIGIEIDPKYFEIAKRRIEAVPERLNFFVKEAKK